VYRQTHQGLFTRSYVSPRRGHAERCVGGENHLLDTRSVSNVTLLQILYL